MTTLQTAVFDTKSYDRESLLPVSTTTQSSI
jgi:hypothetical protein